MLPLLSLPKWYAPGSVVINGESYKTLLISKITSIPRRCWRQKPLRSNRIHRPKKLSRRIGYRKVPTRENETFYGI